MSALFQPIRLGGLDVSNRIAVSPMCQYSAVDGLAQPWHLVHLGGLMLSGAGLVILEATAVQPEGRITPGCLGLFSDATEAALTGLVANLRGLSGARIGIQLAHAGRRASCQPPHDRWKGDILTDSDGAWQTVAPSALPVAPGWHVPQAFDADAIARLIADFAAAARRADRAGIDLVELHAAHGYLLHQFLSPLTNHRQDAWGGNPENRRRVVVDIVRSIRAVWPASKALGVRVNSTDWHPDGLMIDDALDLVAVLKAEGVDYVVMSAGNLVPDARIPPATPGHQVNFATRAKQHTGLTAMAVGMIADPQQAEDIVASGRADMVAIGRAMLDDPRWGLHAAAALGVKADYPPQYLRAQPGVWPAYPIAHPGSAAA